MNSNTVARNKKIVFKKDADGWYAANVQGSRGANAADGWYAANVQGSRGANAMVQGADVMLEAIAQGRTTVEMVFSADVDDPGDFIMEASLATHVPWGGYYTIKDGNVGKAPAFRGFMGLPLIYLCNQYERFLATEDAAGEHSAKIYIHSIVAE